MEDFITGVAAGAFIVFVIIGAVGAIIKTKIVAISLSVILVIIAFKFCDWLYRKNVDYYGEDGAETKLILRFFYGILIASIYIVYDGFSLLNVFNK